MNFTQLQYLIDISKTNSINATAKRLFSSQQAISESIKRLENELNCTLLNRSKTGVSLTEDGKYVLKYAIHMVNQYNALLTHFKDQDSKQTLQGSLSVGIARLAANTILPKLFLKMDVEYPNVVLYTQEAAIETILYSLIHGQLDFGIFGFLEYPSSQYGGLSQLKELLHSLQIIKLYVDQLVCIMSKNNPLSLQAGIDSQQLAQLKQTAYNYSFDYVPEGSILHVSNHTEIHKKFMLEENTVCCLPYRSFQTLYGEKDFVCLPIVDAEPITTYLAYHDIQNASEGKLYQAFIQTILDLVQI